MKSAPFRGLLESCCIFSCLASALATSVVGCRAAVLTGIVIGSGVLVGVKSLIAGVLFSHAFSGELKAVSVVNKAIQDGVAEGGVADNFVPMLDGDLAGDDGRGATVAIIKDLQKVAPFGRIENRKAPVVEDQELNAAEGFEQAAIATLALARGDGRYGR